MNNETDTTEPQKFKNPYSISPDYISGETGRIQCDIPKHEYEKFYRMLPSRKDAVFQTTFSILTHKLLTTLQNHGFTFTIDDGDRFKDFIAGLQLTPEGKSGDATTGTLREANALDDRTRTYGKDKRNTRAKAK